MERLLIIEEGKEHVYPITSRLVTAGRSSKNDIVLKDRNSSRRHCNFVKVGDTWFVVDCDSQNGTFVNGKRLETKQQMEEGDKVSIGAVEIRFLKGKEGEALPEQFKTNKLGEKQAATNKLEEKQALSGQRPKDDTPIPMKDKDAQAEKKGTDRKEGEESSKKGRADDTPLPMVPEEGRRTSRQERGELFPESRFLLLPEEEEEDDEPESPKSPFPENLTEAVQQIQSYNDRLQQELAKGIVGRHEIAELLVATLLARGHCLLFGVPGMVETALVSSLARSLGFRFCQISLTEDLSPADLYGIRDYRMRGSVSEPVFHPGPLFSHLILADGLERANPRTRAALSDAMQHGRIWLGNVSYALPKPFFVVATWHCQTAEDRLPIIEQSQIDSFMSCLLSHYLSLEDEAGWLAASSQPVEEKAVQVLSAAEIQWVQGVVPKIAISADLVHYIARLIQATRPQTHQSSSMIKEMVSRGAGSHAGRLLISGAKAMAALQGRTEVIASDVQRMIPLVLIQQIEISSRGQAQGTASWDILAYLLDELGQPGKPTGTQ